MPAEAGEAARILGVAWRGALDIPDGRVENTWENRIRIVRKLRELRPRVVILPYWQGRHPDHYNTSTLGYEACFLSGLAKIETGEPPFRPFKIVYASLYADVQAEFRGGHYAVRGGALPGLARVSVPSMQISPPGRGFSSPTMRFASAPFRWPVTTVYAWRGPVC